LVVRSKSGGEPETQRNRIRRNAGRIQIRGRILAQGARAYISWEQLGGSDSGVMSPGGWGEGSDLKDGDLQVRPFLISPRAFQYVGPCSLACGAQSSTLHRAPATQQGEDGNGHRPPQGQICPDPRSGSQPDPRLNLPPIMTGISSNPNSPA
jgi:hypothetical protein